MIAVIRIPIFGCLSPFSTCFFVLEKGMSTSADAKPTMSENKNIFPIKSPFGSSFIIHLRMKERKSFMKSVRLWSDISFLEEMVYILTFLRL